MRQLVVAALSFAIGWICGEAYVLNYIEPVRIAGWAGLADVALVESLGLSSGLLGLLVAFGARTRRVRIVHWSMVVVSAGYVGLLTPVVTVFFFGVTGISAGAMSSPLASLLFASGAGAISISAVPAGSPEDHAMGPLHRRLAQEPYWISFVTGLALAAILFTPLRLLTGWWASIAAMFLFPVTLGLVASLVFARLAFCGHLRLTALLLSSTAVATALAAAP